MSQNEQMGNCNKIMEKEKRDIDNIANQKWHFTPRTQLAKLKFVCFLVCIFFRNFKRPPIRQINLIKNAKQMKECGYKTLSTSIIYIQPNVPFPSEFKGGIDYTFSQLDKTLRVLSL